VLDSVGGVCVAGVAVREVVAGPLLSGTIKFLG
jgi:hypothetical protein